MTDDDCHQLAEARGYKPEFCKWFRDSREIGMFNGGIGFPIRSCAADGAIVGCHVRTKDAWRFEWFVEDAAFKHVTPLILGNPNEARWCAAFESSWDLLAYACCTRWHETADAWKEGCLIATRGATNGGRIQKLLSPDCRVYAWVQNDSPGKTWLSNVASSAGCSVLQVSTPPPHKDLNEWLVADPSADIQQALDSATLVEAAPRPVVRRSPAEPPDWRQLGLINEPDYEGQEFPVHTIVSPFADEIDAVSEGFKVAKALVAISVLGVISTAIGKLRANLLQAYWTPGNLFLLGVAHSGSGKTTAFTPVMSPLHNLQNELSEHWRRQVLPEAKAEKLLLSNRLKGFELAAKKNGASKDMQQQVAALYKKLDELEASLVEPRLIVEDITTEALAVLLQAQGEVGSLLSSDAGAVADNLCGRYRKQNVTDDTLYVKAFSGEPTHVDRVNRPPVHLRSPLLTQLLLVQPNRLTQLLSNATLVQGGLLPRFLMCSVPWGSRRIGDDPIQLPPDVSRAYEQAITTLARKFRLGDESFQIPVSREASRAVADYANSVAARAELELKDVSSFAMRWAEQACRLAIVLHAVRHLAKAAEVELDLNTARDAITLAEWFGNEQLNMLTAYREEDLSNVFTRVWRFAQVKPQGFTLRDLQRGRHVADAETAKHVVDRLVEAQILEEIPNENTTRKVLFRLKPE
jgi:hypothetical protein